MEDVAPTRYARLPARWSDPAPATAQSYRRCSWPSPRWFLDGHSDQAIAAAHRGVELARRLDEEAAAPWSQMQLSAYLGNAYLVSGRLDEAQALAEEGYQRTLRQPWPVENAFWAGWRGQVIRARGRPRTALHWLREAATTGRALGCSPAFHAGRPRRARPRRGAAGRPPGGRGSVGTGRAIHSSIRARLPAVGRISTPVGGGGPRGAVQRRHACPRPRRTTPGIGDSSRSRFSRSTTSPDWAGHGRWTPCYARWSPGWRDTSPRSTPPTPPPWSPRTAAALDVVAKRVRDHRGQPTGGRGGRRSSTRVSRGRAPFQRPRREPAGRNTGRGLRRRSHAGARPTHPATRPHPARARNRRTRRPRALQPGDR